jgi:hypothetical protein
MGKLEHGVSAVTSPQNPKSTPLGIHFPKEIRVQEILM